MEVLVTKVSEREICPSSKGMCDDKTQVKCKTGTTSSFSTKVVLHQSSTFSQFLLRLWAVSETRNRETPWDMIITNDVMLSDQNVKLFFMKVHSLFLKTFNLLEKGLFRV